MCFPMQAIYSNGAISGVDVRSNGSRYLQFHAHVAPAEGNFEAVMGNADFELHVVACLMVADGDFARRYLPAFREHSRLDLFAIPGSDVYRAVVRVHA